MCYTVPDLFTLKGEKLSDLVLEPFFRIHDCRYMMYWLSMNDAEYAEFQKAEREAEQRKLLLDQRTVDAVATAEQQPEVDHKMKYENHKLVTSRVNRGVMLVMVDTSNITWQQMVRQIFR